MINYATHSPLIKMVYVLNKDSFVVAVKGKPAQWLLFT